MANNTKIKLGLGVAIAAALRPADELGFSINTTLGNFGRTDLFRTKK